MSTDDKISAGYSERLLYYEDVDKGQIEYFDLERFDITVDWQGYVHVPIEDTESTHYCF